MDADVSPAIDAPRFVFALDAACGCAFGLHPREMTPNGSAIRAIAISEANS